MPIVIITIIITFFILILWTYRSLGNMEISKKVSWIIIQLLVVFLATYITYGISKHTIEYPNDEIMAYVRNILVLLFTGINGLFVMPFLSRGIEALYQENIVKQQLVMRAVLCIAVLIILLILECGYMTTTQNGILKVMMGDK